MGKQTVELDSFPELFRLSKRQMKQYQHAVQASELVDSLACVSRWYFVYSHLPVALKGETRFAAGPVRRDSGVRLTNNEGPLILARLRPA